MPAAQHPVFKQPADPTIAIWRYMDFTKFVAMLETSALFFARADKLGDPFEGSYSRGNERMRPVVYKDLYEQLKPENVEKFRSGYAEFARWQRQWIFINCWHMNASESAAMWKLYAKTNEAIAVKSSFSRLAELLDGNTFLGAVEYIDFERDWLPEGNTLYPFVHKRLSFSHEQEVRAVFPQLPESGEALDMKAIPPEAGLDRAIDLDALIQEIYVAPTSPKWFKTLVEQVSRRYGLEKPIHQSSLDAQPFF